MDVEINDPSMPELTEIEAEIDVEAEERFELVSTGTQRGKKKLVSSYGYSFVKSVSFIQYRFKNVVTYSNS